MRGHKPGALKPAPGISAFPTLCAAASALSWREHLSPFRQPAGSQGQPGKVSQRLDTCCEVLGSVAGSPCQREVHAFREKAIGVNGKLPFGVVTNHEKLGELTLLDQLGLSEQSANCREPIIGKNR